MKNLKLIVLGTALTAFSVFGLTNFGTTEVEARSSTTYCEWNGSDCKSPTRTNYCGCEVDDEQIQ